MKKLYNWKNASYTFVYERFFQRLFGIRRALLILRNCWVLHSHKQVQGVSVVATVYFTLWASWNLYFYPTIECWFSSQGRFAWLPPTPTGW
jgi:hypothetical protein